MVEAYGVWQSFSLPAAIRPGSWVQLAVRRLTPFHSLSPGGDDHPFFGGGGGGGGTAPLLSGGGGGGGVCPSLSGRRGGGGGTWSLPVISLPQVLDQIDYSDGEASQEKEPAAAV